MLKRQDILVALKLCCHPTPRSYAALAFELGLSASEAHAAIRRLEEARLVETGTREVKREALQEFLVHGAPFAFAVRPMGWVRGTPTGMSASILGPRLTRGVPAPVWPDPDGDTEGCAVEPLYPSVPRAARRDPALYALLALADAFRLGGPEVAGAARGELSARLLPEITVQS